jgi:hypothetical protein
MHLIYGIMSFFEKCILYDYDEEGSIEKSERIWINRACFELLDLFALRIYFVCGCGQVLHE